MNYYVYLAACILLTSVSQVLLKRGTAGRSGAGIYLNLPTITGYVLILLATICTVLALGGIELKTVYAFMSLNFIIIMALSGIFLKERITINKITGTFLIIAGLLVFNLY